MSEPPVLLPQFQAYTMPGVTRVPDRLVTLGPRYQIEFGPKGPDGMRPCELRRLDPRPGEVLPPVEYEYAVTFKSPAGGRTIYLAADPAAPSSEEA